MNEGRVCLGACSHACVLLCVQAVIDTGKLAPYDILMPDEELAPEEVRQVRTPESVVSACRQACWFCHTVVYACTPVCKAAGSHACVVCSTLQQYIDLEL